MIIVYVLMALTIVLSIITVTLQTKAYLGMKFLIKSLASFSFMAMALAAIALLPKVEIWHICVIAALLFGLMGDIFLGTKGIVREEYIEPLLLAGLLFFLVGHIIYIIVFMTIINSYVIYLFAIVIVFPLIIYVLMKKNFIEPKKATLPIIMYSSIIALMFVAALNFIIATKGSTKGVLVFVGAVLFTLSDLLLVFYNFRDFGNNLLIKNTIAFVYMPTYYVAQTLFVLAMVL